MSQGRMRVIERLPRPLRRAGVLVARTARSTVEDRVPGLAAEAAFFALLSLPPLLLAIVGSIGYIAELLGPEARADIEAVVLSIPAAFLAPETFQIVETLLVDVLAEGRLEIVSLGFLVSLWGGSRAVNVYLVALPIAYDVEEPRPMWRRRLLAYVLTLGGSLVLAVVIPALVLGPELLLDLFGRVLPGPIDEAVGQAFALAFWPTLVVLTVLLITVLYDLGVPWQTPLRRDLPGAVLAMVIWVLGGAALRFYADTAIRGDDIYGPLATPLVLLLWMYVTAIAVLLGGELNAQIERLWPHAREEQPAGDEPAGDAAADEQAAEDERAEDGRDEPSEDVRESDTRPIETRAPSGKPDDVE
jgi:membrane protein